MKLFKKTENKKTENAPRDLSQQELVLISGGNNLLQIDPPQGPFRIAKPK